MTAASRAELLRSLGDIGQTERRLDEIVEQLRKPLGVTPFVGAGLSHSVGFPTWKDFLTQQAAGDVEIEGRIAETKFEQAALELLEQGHGSFQRGIRDTFGRDLSKLTPEDLQGTAVSLLPQITTGPVITTNLDRVLERAFECFHSPFEHTIIGNTDVELAITSLFQSRRFLLKLHGDADDEEYRVFTADDYDKQYGDLHGSGFDWSRPLPRLLHQIIVSRPLLFLGCSLNQDRTVEVLRRVAEGFPVQPFAILSRPTSDEEFDRRSAFLFERHIRPIWYPPREHGFIRIILQYLIDETLGRRYLVTGSMETNSPSLERFKGACRELGRVLATRADEVIVGSSRERTADRYVVEGLDSVASGSRHKVRLIWPEDGKYGEPFRGEQENFGHIEWSLNKRSRGNWRPTSFSQIRAASGVIVIGGGGRTKQVFYSALNADVPIVAIGSFGGTANDHNVWKVFERNCTEKGLDPLRIAKLREPWSANHAELAMSVLEDLRRRTSRSQQE